MERLRGIERNYGIDLLRIVSMLMIVMLHVLRHGGILGNSIALSVNYNIAWLLEIACFCAVDVYAIISGYVSRGSEKLEINKLIKIWISVMTYSVVLAGVMKLLYPDKVGLFQILTGFLPICTKQYWYFNSYVCVFIVMPYLNILADKLTKKQFEQMLLSIFLLFSVLTTIINQDLFQISFGYCGGWLIVCYLIGVYIKKYGISERIKYPGCIYGLSVAVMWLFKAGMNEKTFFVSGYEYNSDWIIQYTSPFVVICAICLVSLFAGLKINKEWMVKVIKFFAPATFGVYLLHDNQLVRKNLMSGSFQKYLSYSPGWFVIAVILTVIVIFLVCALIERVRIWMFKKIGIDKIISKI